MTPCSRIRSSTAPTSSPPAFGAASVLVVAFGRTALARGTATAAPSRFPHPTAAKQRLAPASERNALRSSPSPTRRKVAADEEAVKPPEPGPTVTTTTGRRACGGVPGAARPLLLCADRGSPRRGETARRPRAPPDAR